MDTVINGGMFDGAAGVLMGIEVLQTMHEQNIALDHAVEVVIFTDEEGARFSSGMLGSQAFIGKLTEPDLENSFDTYGISIADAMRQQGYKPEHVASAEVKPKEIKCYLELHIEQGKVLESQNIPVGLVTGMVGLRWLKIKLTGEAGHAGTTPMNFRKDPMACAAEIIQVIETLARNEQQTVATIGKLSVQPGGINVIPSEVEFTVDMRDLSDALLDELVEEIGKKARDISEQRGIIFDLQILDRSNGVTTIPSVNEAIAAAIRKNDIELVKLPSGAGHDAMNVAQITDIGMIFLRTKDGISHNPAEWADQADLAMGAEVLLDTFIELGKRCGI
ncbi:Zn-dependent hydrolase [Paraliobacillus quinghaiensis]|uniref:Zn-dependent hydrolase n=1 Tax=Paraliobacillus quinghaiensis TaxID=470815 RepID=UPI001E6049F9|nr:Zn-dependent hydrolase [Paraliobacillus quinghaiensis]